ncbi:hypothetical protein HWV62_29827 [Athelia sp. TMB]|nr:hypothetical protein HWV62_40913 [Athelia sp. TMB]KAF7982113.1 hypothetical protein HWV62_29827 [Athelia sp. TMB]
MNFSTSCDGFELFPQSLGPSGDFFSYILMSRPTADNQFDAQGAGSFDYGNTASETEGGHDDFWFYDLLDVSMLQPPDSVPSYELFTSASNEQGTLFDEVGFVLEDAPQEEARQGLGFSLHFSSQAAIGSGSASVIATFPDNLNFYILFFSTSNPEALQWSQIALQASTVSDCILTMDDGALFLILATGSILQGFVMPFNPPGSANNVNPAPSSPSAGAPGSTPPTTPTSPDPIDRAIPVTAASSPAPMVEGATSSAGPSTTKRKAPRRAVCQHSSGSDTQHPDVPAVTTVQAEDLSNAIPVSPGVLMLGSKNGRQTLPAARLKKIYKRLAIVSIAPGTNKCETRYHCDWCHRSYDEQRIQDFSRHRNNAHRSSIPAKEYTPLFLCTSCGLISPRKDIADRHWEEICGKGKVRKTKSKKSAPKMRKSSSKGSSKKAGKRRSKMDLISS